METLKKNDILYYARILPSAGLYEICELKIRTVMDTWFVGIEKREKHAYLFGYQDIGTILFYDRGIALDRILDAEKNAPKTEYEAEQED